MITGWYVNDRMEWTEGRKGAAVKNMWWKENCMTMKGRE